MASEGWLTTATIMLQQADRMRRTHHLHLAASICCGLRETGTEEL